MKIRVKRNNKETKMRELKKWWSKKKREENMDWTYAIWEFKTSFFSSNFPLKKKVISNPHISLSSAILIY